ncbi:MAG: FkbM family methyltransferase [Nanoarchaeota archaeon]|nr:FkbM family methyltransferase [Nanoarchaeota archaeon]
MKKIFLVNPYERKYLEDSKQSVHFNHKTILKVLKRPLFFSKKIFHILTQIPYKIRISGEEIFVLHRGYWDTVQFGTWEPHTFKILSRFLNKEHSFIDIGAWIGAVTLYGSKIAKCCYSLEPDPQAFRELSDNVSFNDDLKSKIKLYDYCISNKNGRIKFGNKESFGSSESSILFGDEEKSMFVESITLQKFFKENNIIDCNLIKMDIEGGESLVIPTIKKFLIDNKKPTLYLSLHPLLFKQLEKDSKRIIKVIKIYKNIYDIRGNKLELNDLFLKLLGKSFFEIIATNEEFKLDE